MKKFLEDFLNWLAIMGFTIILAPIWDFILTYGFNVDLANFSKKIGVMLIVFPPFIISGFLVSLFEEQEKENNTPKEDEPKEDEPKEDEPKEDEPKEDEPKEDEIITVTEIQGERNIIVVKIIVFIIGLVLTGIFTLCGSIIGLLPLIFAIMYCFKTNDKNKD